MTALSVGTPPASEPAGTPASGRTRTGPAALALLDRVLVSSPPPFALLYRPETTGPGVLDVLVGEVSYPDTIADVPLPPTGVPGPSGPGHDTLVLVPHRQVVERGFECVDDRVPLLAMTVTAQATVSVAEALDRVPDVPIVLSGERFEPDDADYAETVRRVVADEIGTGLGANFVVRRSFVAELGTAASGAAAAFFCRLLCREAGVYWTFLVRAGGRTFVGATPERHISVRDGLAVMNPISGTYRYPESGPTLPEVMEFLADRKEADELYMVVDEELKMMARICEGGGRLVGPYLKEMARLAHTEYLIEGRTTRDPREILRETMFAPTVTGSPLESACRVIARYEPEGRGYYGGVAALIGRDANGGRTLDSAILIRTAELDDAGSVRVGVGATLVRHSDPDSEVAETRAKAAGLIAALRYEGHMRLSAYPLVRDALMRRNDDIAGFWRASTEARPQHDPLLAGRRVVVVDQEDTFTAMLAHQLRALGLDVRVHRYDEAHPFDGADLVVMGPGPGDPGSVGDPKMRRLRADLRALLDEQRPFLAVCLSHQVLSSELGLALARRDRPNQGVQREVNLFGVTERVGFYNSFAARAEEDKLDLQDFGRVEVSRDAANGEVHALRGSGFASVQFHPESVLTQAGPRLVASLLRHALTTSTATTR